MIEYKLFPYKLTSQLDWDKIQPLHKHYDIPCKSPDYEMVIDPNAVFTYLILKDVQITDSHIKIDEYRWTALLDMVKTIDGSLNPVHPFVNLSYDYQPVSHIDSAFEYLIPLVNRLIEWICLDKCTLLDVILWCRRTLTPDAYESVLKVIIHNYLRTNAVKRDEVEF